MGSRGSGDGSGPSGTSRPQNNGGFWPGIVGGVIGGAATALAASLFWIGGDDSAATAALESRLAAAEQQSGQVAELSERIATVEAAPAGTSEGGDDLAGRLDTLEARFADLGETPAEGGGDAGLGDRLTALEEQIENLGAAPAGGEGGLGEQLAAIEQRVETLAADVQSAGETQQASVATLASVESALPALQDVLAATGKNVEDAGSRTTELSKTVGTLNDEMQTLTDRLGETEGRLDHLGGEYQRGAAMIVAIGDVDRAINRAEPFDSALQSLRLLLRDEAVLGETLSSLEPMAADGVPTTGNLKDEFGEMASRVLLAEKGDRSIADQVGDNVFGIFNVRPSGANVEGSDSRAILARAQAALAKDDLEGTIGELGGLEGPAADVAGTWIERAQARLSAEAAVVDLRSHAQGLVAKGA